jgi:hypothetical protein
VAGSIDFAPKTQQSQPCQRRKRQEEEHRDLA